jgi:hypothetical protein
MTFAPRSMKWRAMARPTPLAAPVMIAVLPWIESVICGVPWMRVPAPVIGFAAS